MTLRFARKKRLLSATVVPAVVVLAAAGALSGCGSDDAKASSNGTVELRYQGSVGSVGIPELAADLGYFQHIKLKWVGNTISGPQDIQSAATGQTDFGGAFNGAVAKLITSGAPIKEVVSYYGSDDKTQENFEVLDDSPIKTPRDLIGKKVGMNTVGGNYEAVLDAYLRKNGLSESEIKSVQKVVLPPINTEESLRRHQIDVAGLGGLFLEKAQAAGGVHPLFKDTDLFGTYNGGGIVFTNSFIKKHPDTVREFVTGVHKAIEWSKTTPLDQVQAKFTDIINKRGRSENSQSIKFFKSFGVATSTVSDEDFTRWFPWLKNTGVDTDKLKASDFYTNEFNPSAPKSS